MQVSFPWTWYVVRSVSLALQRVLPKATSEVEEALGAEVDVGVTVIVTGHQPNILQYG